MFYKITNYSAEGNLKYIMDLVVLCLTFLILHTSCARTRDLKKLHKQRYINDDDILRCWNVSANKDTLRFYEDSGCSVKFNDKRNCSVVKNCPKVCFSKRKRTGDDGIKNTITKVHEIGDSWSTKKESCKCYLAKNVMPASMPNLLVDSLGVYTPTPHLLPTSVCYPKGCKHHYKNKLLKEGATMQTPQGLSCTCVKGSNPNMSNVNTLYHWSCQKPDR